MILSMWERQDRSLEISTPRYLAQDLAMETIICTDRFPRPGSRHLDYLALHFSRIRLMAIETFKIVHKMSPVYLHDLLSYKN